MTPEALETISPPGKQLVLQVRIGFLKQGTNLNEWCRRKGYSHGSVWLALMGQWDGPKGRKLRERVIKAALR